MSLLTELSLFQDEYSLVHSMERFGMHANSSTFPAPLISFFQLDATVLLIFLRLVNKIGACLFLSKGIFESFPLNLRALKVL